MALALVLLATHGCVVKLDDEFDSHAGPPAPVASGCRVLLGGAPLAGDVHSLDLGAGQALVVADYALAAPAPRVNAPGFIVQEPLGADCAWSATATGTVLGPSPIRADALLAPLDLVPTAAGFGLYYTLFVPDASAPFGVRGLGVGFAPSDAGSAHFVPGAELLWSADRPAYGSSALRVGKLAYVYGCKQGGFLEEDCFVARVDVSQVANALAYTYFTGATWSASPDDAAPIASAGSPVSVRADPARSRYVMTYVPPLGQTLVARTAIAPEGPWSAPTTLASCDLAAAGAGAFCGGGQQHTGVVSVPAGQIAVTYSARTFDAGGNTGDAYAPRLVLLPLP